MGISLNVWFINNAIKNLNFIVYTAVLVYIWVLYIQIDGIIMINKIL